MRGGEAKASIMNRQALIYCKTMYQTTSVTFMLIYMYNSNKVTFYFKSIRNNIISYVRIVCSMHVKVIICMLVLHVTCML